MRALVVVESIFGNTRAVADAVSEGLSARMTVDVVDVGAASPVIGDDVDLLVVGGPTHAFGLSRPGTRRSAAAQRAGGATVPIGIGLREWLGTLQAGSRRVAVATFDTRMARPRLPGSAARAAGRRLRRLGCRLIASPASFYVAGTPGPLRPGELERARRWGRLLGSDVAAERPGRVT